jgi:GTP-binding protein LepA
MEIIQERLEREFDLDLITTAPGVNYRVTTMKGEVLEIVNPNHLPAPNYVARIEEPYITATIITRDDFLGGLLKLCEDRHGTQKSLEYLAANRVVLTYDFPLNEVVMDFYDKLKSISKGYASFDYEFAAYREGDLVKLDLLVNGDPVDALSLIVHRDEAPAKGRFLAAKIRTPGDVRGDQAAIGAKIIAREQVSAIRKTVLAKCYGGDITRKRKLLEKQKEGKKRMKRVGRVDIPQEAFLAVLKVE